MAALSAIPRALPWIHWSKRSMPPGSGAPSSTPRAPPATPARRRRQRHRRARCGTPARRGEARHRVGHASVAEESRSAFVSTGGHQSDRPRGSRGAVSILRQGSDEVRRVRRRGVRAGGRARRSARGRAARGVHRAQCRADAELRQHRRLRRLGHHGRHLGDCRLVRTDRPQRASFRRRGHRRGLGTDPGQPPTISKTIASSERAPRWSRA